MRQATAILALLLTTSLLAGCGPDYDEKLFEQVNQGRDDECGNVLDYQCGTMTICGGVHEYGDCQQGYECKDNLCIASDDKTCNDVTCEEGEYCARGVCLLEVPGNTHYVATWGDDTNPGTYEQPFYTWQKAVEASMPGDLTYLRGGVWYADRYIKPSSTIGMLIDPTGYTPDTRGGTAEKPIRYYNYPGERPILDGSLMTPSGTQWLSGIGIGQVEHIHLRGLTVRQIHQTPPNMSHEKPYSEVFGIGSGGANHHFENMVVHDIDGRAYQHWSDAWSREDAEYAVEAGYQEEIQVALFEKDETTWINCDAYNLFDRYDDTPGNAADGWKVETYHGSTFTWKGCRAWNYSDDGFDPHGSGKRVFEDCWAMSTLKYHNLSDAWGIEGNGFKTTGSSGIQLPEGESGVIFKGCIAAYNIGSGHGTGFITNLGGVDESQGSHSSRPSYYHNLAYYNTWGYSGRDNADLRNNIVYGSQAIGPVGETYELVFAWDDMPAIESGNNWESLDPTPGSWPWWRYNPQFNVTDEDFISLDMSQLARPRKPDGSLPDITFGHLAPGSDLIDGGTVIEGYHCPTPGEHPGEDCREWHGEAPDLGAFEHQG